MALWLFALAALTFPVGSVSVSARLQFFYFALIILSQKRYIKKCFVCRILGLFENIF
nr:MAG TPA: hypothetical protein [Microviridae sp.]